MFLVQREPMATLLRPHHFHDLGKLMFAFVMLWAYFNFSQYLLTYAANLIEEIPYMTVRTSNGWQFLALFLVIFHFAVPWLLLLSRDVTARRQRVERVQPLQRFVQGAARVGYFDDGHGALDAAVDPKVRPESFERIIEGIRDYFDARALLDHVTRALRGEGAVPQHLVVGVRIHRRAVAERRREVDAEHARPGEHVHADDGAVVRLEDVGKVLREFGR